MPYSKHYVTLEDLPPERREELRPWSKNINEFMEAVGVDMTAVKLDQDGISGTTPEQKAAFHSVMAKLMPVVEWLHSKRFNFSLLGFNALVVVIVLKYLGVQPEQFARFVEAIIRIIEKWA